MLRLLGPLLALCLAAAPALAHQLRVFAFVEAGEVVVEARFSTGRIPVSGTVEVRGADDALLLELELGAEGTVRFPLDPDAAEGGLAITVITGEGHEDYWILTPADISAGQEGDTP